MLSGKVRSFLSRTEWPTLAVLVLCYGVWAVATTYLATISLWLAIPVTAFAAALQSSLQHEIIHGHPFANRHLNEALVFPSLNLFIPFQRFRATHLAHHTDAILTDPYDDPESNYMDAGDWDRLPRVLKLSLRANNTLLGRMLLGPLISQHRFMLEDLRLIRQGDRSVAMGWALHIPGCLLVIAWLIWTGTMPIWAYLVAAYLALSLLKIRTFLEHQAHEKARGRTVIIEDRGPLGFVFLNNNYHVVHHMHPRVAWFRLPALYRAHKARFLACNEGYYFPSYGAVFRTYLLKGKDPVAHPLWRRG
ncbi:MAG: fatty acid desaturase [Paracoccaceae bacterium]